MKTETIAELKAELRRICFDDSIELKTENYEVAINETSALTDRQKGYLDRLQSELGDRAICDVEWMEELETMIDNLDETAKSRSRCQLA